MDPWRRPRLPVDRLLPRAARPVPIDMQVLSGAVLLHVPSGPADAAAMSEQLTVEQVQDLEEVLRVFRRQRQRLIAGALLVIAAIVVSTFAVVFARDADQQIHALSAEAAANQAQAKAFEGFLQGFVAEQNYMCSVEAAEAVRDGLPPPPKGVCAVALPTTRPTPPATPQPAPTAAPVAPRPTAAATASARPSSATPFASPLPTATPAAERPTPAPRRCLLALICLLPPGCVHSLRHPHCG